MALKNMKYCKTSNNSEVAYLTKSYIREVLITICAAEVDFELLNNLKIFSLLILLGLAKTPTLSLQNP